jgi:hypothetical protein
MLEAAGRHALHPEEIPSDLAERLLLQFNLRATDFAPRVYYRLTENWLELSLRFVFHDHGTRAVKDHIAREILDAFETEGIAVAAPSLQIVGLPAIDRPGR